MEMRLHAFRLLYERSLHMPEMHTLLTGLAFGESPRWHDGRLWVADWGAQEIIAVNLEGKSEVIVKVNFPSFPMCFDWLPDGQLLIVSSRNGLLLRMESGGSLAARSLAGLSLYSRPTGQLARLPMASPSPTAWLSHLITQR